MPKRFLYFIFTINLYSVVYPQYSDLIFNNINFDKGISDREVIAITQDYKGYIWIGTINGLNKYDGHTFKVYLNDPADKTSISNNYIRCIFEDSKHRLWICTTRGLNLYIRELDRFVSFFHAGHDSITLGNDLVTTMYEDRSGNLWVGHYDGFSKLLIDDKFPLENQHNIKFLNYAPIPNSQQGSTNWIYSICQDKDGDLWMGSRKEGIFRFNIGTHEIKNYPIDENHSDYWIIKVFLDLDSNVWASLFHNHGLVRYDKAKDEFIKFKLKDNKGRLDAAHINTIYDVAVDKNNTFWMATDYGLQIYNHKNGFNTGYASSPENIRGLNDNQLRTVFFDKNNGLWIGTADNGIDYSDRNLIKYTLINSSKYPVLQANQVTSLACNSGDEIFFNVFENGVYKYIPVTDRLVKIDAGIEYCEMNSKSDIVYAFIKNKFYYKTKNYSEENFRSVPAGFTLTSNIKVNSRGDAWGMNAQGLSFYDRKTESTHLVICKKDIDSIFHYDFEMFVDETDSLWFLAVAFPKKKLFKVTNTNKCIEHYLSLYETKIKGTSTGDLWFAKGESLLYFNKNTKSVTEYGPNEGFNGKKTYSLEFDNKENIWVTSNKGIFKFDCKQHKFTNYSEDDGLPNCKFNNLTCRDSKGNIYFGSSHGILVINPEDFHTNTNIPPIVLTGFKLFNKPIFVNPDSTADRKNFYLEKNISETQEIVLKYYQNVITIEYIALNYVNPSKNQYAYRMEGLDPESSGWNYVGTQKFANYSGLQPGNYVFRIKGSNNNNVWNEKGISLKIKILPPFWQTWWFRFLIVFILIISFILFYRRRVRSLIEHQQLLEEKVSERTHEIEMQKKEINTQKDEITEKADKLKLLNATKDKFFSIIAHDLKNPFSVISSFSDLIISEFDKTTKEEKINFVTAIKNSSSSAYSLLENLLQWARSQTSQVALNPTRFDLHTLVFDTCQLLRINADKKKICLVNNVPPDTMIAADRNMLGTVIRNLVNNAVKFSLENTKITVSSVFENDSVIISVNDQGIGIEQNTIEKLFRIDQHVTNPGTSGETGTGLGLIVCYEFIKKHNGTIWVESKKGEGTAFYIKLPLKSNEKLTVSEVKEIQIPPLQSEPGEKIDGNVTDQLQDEAEKNIAGPHDLSSILLIDDNADIRSNIREHLKGFSIHEAPNGKEGFEIAIEQIPDLIVCDWMMPEMDGIMFCKMIKEDERTSHIPCIMLTAKNATDDETEGLKTGADDYITKPFNTRNLVIKIKNILESKRKLREKFARDMGTNIRFESGSDIDNKFIEKVMAVINKHISEPEFGFEVIAEEMGMSKTSLYRKIKALTNLSVHLFIRNIRLHKAAELFRQRERNISQVVYQVGFNDHSYFTKCFVELFKKTPSDYISGIK